ncbi:MAG: DUF4249 domain-containing protein [Flavobacteriaceae bacterium]|nr:DUF4249 domain-containing protein [Flavobacteriaceae bacterium]
MNIFKTIYIIFISLLSVFVFSCTELIDIDDQLSFEDVIVIEASITNEYKYQKIILSRTFRFEDEGPKAESNASVNIIDSANNTYIFTENDPGVYFSTTKFEAVSNVDYQLFITLNDGKEYATTNKQLSNTTQIDNLYASRETNSIGSEVMSVFVDSYDANRNSNYYRYEYEETYKIVAPNWVNQDFIILTNDDGNILPLPGLVPRSNDEKVCYNTVLSNAITQISTTDLAEDRVSKFSVRNIPIDDAIISHRYSILVKQYVQSLEAYTYYNILNQLSGSSSLFSQIQPGFINSNIYALDNKNEKVLGFFELTSVSEKRLFFNYTDFFPSATFPQYFVDCEEIAPVLVKGAPPRFPLIEAIQEEQVVYWEENINAPVNEGPFLVVPTACGHCTALGTSEKPEFWID